MHYEFSWEHDGQQKHFSTSCPTTAETMMRSQSDFPKRSAEIQSQFDELYAMRGAFEGLLRRASEGSTSHIQTGIHGLMVKIVRNEGVELC